MERSALSDTGSRAEAMRLFALAPWPLLDAETKALQPDYAVLRGPETGLVMLRGRMGSTGNAFNVGEATVTRCTIKLASGREGHAYVQGRNGEHARRAALCDALFQENPALVRPALQAIGKHLEKARLETAAKAAATKVDFFTMVRGDD